MRIVSPSNLSADFSRSLLSNEHIPMLRREVLDTFLRDRAVSCGARLIPGLFTSLEAPSSPSDPYLLRYVADGSTKAIEVDVVVGADGANSRVAKSIDAGPYSVAIAFQERIRLPSSLMDRYADLAEIYVGEDVSPDFYGWVFPKCDHVAVGTGTTVARSEIKKYQAGIRARIGKNIAGGEVIKKYQAGIRARIGKNIAGGEVIKVEAHPIPEHPRPRRVRGRVALVGDAAGYVTKCSGEGIYFAAKSGRMCGEAILKAWKGGNGMVTEEDLKREYLRKWDEEYIGMFRFLHLLQRVFYGSNAAREALVELCTDDYVQRMTFESYFYKKMAAGNPWKDVGLFVKTMGSLIRAGIVGREVERLAIATGIAIKPLVN
ncbi:hypothetical protein HPP92_028186 [Vanilla planifolia]|uniref:Digeranylgeranylglycerophospholipid reductase catalytic domain-containing protein n=1 Tax=Vanilla planifolia TaxID=51239 RepID=A0A835U482_VANPL|nr:hypothetical protein HPP92_028186 [Vanilla planifolia]